jgi:hypothetical protein
MKNRQALLTLTLSMTLLVAGAGMAEAATVGTVINNVRDSLEKLPFVLSSVAYISGLFLAAAGLFKFKDHVDNPAQTPLSAGVKRFLAGGMFLSGPYMYDALHGTLYGAQAVGANELRNTGYTTATLTPGGLDEMIVKFMTDIGGPIESLLTAFTYISAIVLLLVGISRLTKRMEEGPKGPAGLGTMMTFLASGALFSFGDMMGTFSTSLFGNSTVMTQATITAAVIDPADADKIAKVVEAIMTFVMIVGFIAFIRGWFVLKAFADGQSGATLAQGLTFLFGGALAINLGELVNVLQTTLGIGGITFG